MLNIMFSTPGFEVLEIDTCSGRGLVGMVVLIDFWKCCGWLQRKTLAMFFIVVLKSNLEMSNLENSSSSSRAALECVRRGGNGGALNTVASLQLLLVTNDGDDQVRESGLLATRN